MKVNINAEIAAISLARSDDEEQSRFLNSFSKELKAYCRSEHDLDVQICSFSDNLNEESISLIKTIAEFLQQRGK